MELRRNGIVHAVSTTDDEGAFAFQPGIAGEYALATAGGAATAYVDLEQPDISVEITAALATPRYLLIEKRLLPAEETDNRSLFFGRVLDAAGEGINGIELEMRWTDAGTTTRFPRTRTGQDATKPAGYYEFLHSLGEFMVQVVAGDYESDVADELVTTNVPGRCGRSHRLRGQFPTAIP